MKKILSILIITAAAVIFITGCKSGASSSDPKATLKLFFEKMSKKDIDGAKELATKESAATLDMMKKGLEMAEKMKDSINTDNDATEKFKDAEFGEATIDGETAKVPITNTKTKETIDFPLKKEDGKWKVDFSMGTLMQMGMKEMNKRGEHPITEDGDTGNIQMPSKEEMEKGMKIADSVLKNIDPKKLEEVQKLLEEAQKKQ